MPHHRTASPAVHPNHRVPPGDFFYLHGAISLCRSAPCSVRSSSHVRKYTPVGSHLQNPPGGAIALRNPMPPELRRSVGRIARPARGTPDGGCFLWLPHLHGTLCQQRYLFCKARCVLLSAPGSRQTSQRPSQILSIFPTLSHSKRHFSTKPSVFNQIKLDLFNLSFKLNTTNC